MNTETLIEALSRNVPSVPRHALRWRLVLGIAAGGIVSTVLICLGLGLRPDLWIAMHGFPFWMKWIYTISLGLVALVATARLARPDTGVPRWLWIALAPVGALTATGAIELARTPPADWLAMWLGESWMACPWLVFLLSLPIFAGLLWSFRRLAPTRLRAAGATAGLAAGAWSATLYCLHCPEVSAIFVLTWYSLGIGLAALAGALIGPKLLRW